MYIYFIWRCYKISLMRTCSNRLHMNDSRSDFINLHLVWLFLERHTWKLTLTELQGGLSLLFLYITDAILIQRMDNLFMMDRKLCSYENLYLNYKNVLWSALMRNDFPLYHLYACLRYNLYCLLFLDMNLANHAIND